MELTIWGLIFIPLGIVILLLDAKLLIPLLILSLSLQMTSLINIPTANYGFQLYRYLTILISFAFFIQLFRKGLRIKFENRFFKKMAIILFAFSLYATIISFLGPLIFKGYHVFPPSIGIDYSALFGPSPLKFSSLNIAMPLYILFYFLTFLYLIIAPLTKKDIELIQKSWKITITLTLILLIIQFISFFLGYNNILSFINNTKQREYVLSTYSYLSQNFPRLQGTFLEPSMASPFLIGMFIYLLDLIKQRSKQEKKFFIRFMGLLIIIFLLFLTTSTTAYISTFIMLVIYLILNRPIKRRDFKLLLDKRISITLFSLLLSIILFALIIQNLYGKTLITNIFETFLFNKPESLSYHSRLASDIYSFKLFLDTYFIGVGLGSHRSSSLLSTLLSTTGIIGIIFFILYIYIFLKYTYKELKDIPYSPYFYLIPSVLISMFIALPDITFPTFWQFLYMTIIILRKINYEKTETYGNTNFTRTQS
jgi:hypothetical protein